jgi:uncharacterized membrane protein
LAGGSPGANVLIQIGEALQDNSVIATLNSVAWMAASLEIVHYFSMFVLVGSIAIVDLRVMGLVGKQYNLSILGRRLFPWIWTALALNALSGFLMFGGLAASYIPNPVFHIKMWLIVAALAFTVIVQWQMPAWDEEGLAAPGVARVFACISLLLWVGAILASNELSAIYGLG